MTIFRAFNWLRSRLRPPRIDVELVGWQPEPGEGWIPALYQLPPVDRVMEYAYAGGSPKTLFAKWSDFPPWANVVNLYWREP